MGASERLSAQIPDSETFAAADFFQVLVKKDGLQAIKRGCRDLAADCAELSVQVSFLPRFWTMDLKIVEFPCLPVL
jgi:hypothetical protein